MSPQTAARLLAHSIDATTRTAARRHRRQARAGWSLLLIALALAPFVWRAVA